VISYYNECGGRYGSPSLIRLGSSFARKTSDVGLLERIRPIIRTTAWTTPAHIKLSVQYITETGTAVNGAKECHISEAQSSISAAVSIFCSLVFWIRFPWTIVKNQKTKHASANAPHPITMRFFTDGNGRTRIAPQMINAGRINVSHSDQPQRTASTASTYSGRNNHSVSGADRSNPTNCNYHWQNPLVPRSPAWLSGNFVNLHRSRNPAAGGLGMPVITQKLPGCPTDRGFFPGLFQHWFLCGRRVHPVSRQPTAYPASRRCPAYRAVNGLASFCVDFQSTGYTRDAAGSSGRTTEPFVLPPRIRCSASWLSQQVSSVASTEATVQCSQFLCGFDNYNR
jgi:hypothetical protein